MQALELFVWWYSDGYRRLLSGILPAAAKVYQAFSMPILMSTLLQPWRRVVTFPGESLGDKLKALVDNGVSRFVGFGVRLLALLTACVVIAFELVGGLLLVIAWPLAPVLAVVLIVWGLA